MTQRELADKLDMDESTIRAIESGRRGVSLETLVAIAGCLGVDAGGLVDEKPAKRGLEAVAASIVGDLSPKAQACAVRILKDLSSLTKR